MVNCDKTFMSTLNMFSFFKFQNYKLFRLREIFMHTWLEIQNDCKKIIIMFKQRFYTNTNH